MPGTPPLNTATTRAGEVVAVVMKGKFAIIDTGTNDCWVNWRLASATAKPVFTENTDQAPTSSANTILCVSNTARYVAYGTGDTVRYLMLHMVWLQRWSSIHSMIGTNMCLLGSILSRTWLSKVAQWERATLCWPFTVAVLMYVPVSHCAQAI